MASNYEETKRAEYKKAFDKYDTDHSGTLHVGEVTKLMQDLGLNIGQKDTAKRMAIVDADENKKLDFEEFVAFFQNAKKEYAQMIMDQLSEDRLAEYKKAFTEYDTDGNYTLKLVDLAAVCEDLGVKGTNDVTLMKEVFAEYDTDGDGSIDFREFIVLITKLDAKLTVTRVVESLTQEKRAEYEEEFKKHDKDGSGVIDKGELFAIMKNRGIKLNMGSNEFKQKWVKADVDNSGKLHFNEFVYFIEAYKE